MEGVFCKTRLLKTAEDQSTWGVETIGRARAQIQSLNGRFEHIRQRIVGRVEVALEYRLCSNQIDDICNIPKRLEAILCELVFASLLLTTGNIFDGRELVEKEIERLRLQLTQLHHFEIAVRLCEHAHEAAMREELSLEMSMLTFEVEETPNTLALELQRGLRLE
ncbi:hypothetical protein K470DRAFT_258067 [Piedraia hortae CBS 480.64]|uniref:Uncharacterized protein n=1 Tax=Piedraia hortae CBS 480.64 TaxID=1314780 RepID=A0A6A7BZ26_9PEZI|nr:hypothetical protein K470DRAFT_258067 [Piedraia hortae CBS 480.64]